ncbi:MAG: PorT family protein [Bacteroidales bacterium]|nr:PorT family protein [Bacteroidales bacterium]
MKRNILLAIILVFGMNSLFSQVKPFRFGVKVAPDFSWISPDTKDYENDGMVPGFSWGFLADITLTDNYFVKTGFSVDYVGGKLTYPHSMLLDESQSALTAGTLKRKYSLRYLEIPATIKMRTNQFNNMAFYGEIGFGGYFNLKAKGKDEFTPDGSSTVVSDDGDIKDEISFMRASMIVGAGMEYFIDESTSLIFSVDFNNGLTNVLNGKNNIDASLNERAQLYYFQLNVGVMF